MSLSVSAVERRFLILQALRWLPVGFVAPLLVLVLTRDLSLTRLGPLMAIYSITTAMLELPTGGLADSIGRRPVLLVSSISNIIFFALLLTSSSFSVLAVALFVSGVSRALDSGPLESWFVDRTKALDPNVDLRRGLSRAGVVDGTALGLGAVLGGVLPQLFDGRILISVVVALVFQVIHLLAVFALMDEQKPHNALGLGRALSTLPTTVRAGIDLAARRPSVRRLLGGAATIGVALVAVESLWQPRFVTLLNSGSELGGDANPATAFLGVLLAVAFLGGAVGAGVAPSVAARLETWTTASASLGQFAGALALAAMAVANRPVLAAVAFVLFYVFNGAAAPIRDELLHEQVPGDARSTVLSVESLVFQFGGFAAALTLPALGDAKGIGSAWLVASLALGLGALLYLGIGRRPSAEGQVAPDSI